jgi:imidazolonepropionase-like amidohydrolase
LSPRDQIVSQLRLFAQYGVTTAYVMGGAGDSSKEIVAVGRDQRHGTLDGARVYVSTVVVRDSVAEAREAVDKAVALGVDLIKTRLNRNQMNDMVAAYGRSKDMPPEVYGAVIDQAHKHGLRVLAHLYILDDAKGLVSAGLDVIGHAVRDQDLDPAFIAELKRRDVGYVPTMARDLAVFEYETTPAYFSDPFFLRGVSIFGRDMEEIKNPAFQEKVRNSTETPVIKKALQQNSRNLKLLADAGVAIAMGTDSGADVGQWQGYSEHVEMELMVKAGLTPMQTIVSATGGAARVMRLDSQLGTLQPGKWADFIVLSANPLADIRNTRQIDSVWIAGRRLGPTGTK